MLFQATSSRQMSSIKVLVTTEMPGAPTAEALWDMGTRSAAVVSRPTWGITRSQAEIRSIGRQAETRLHQLETKWRELPRQSGLPLYMWCELTTSQVRLVQEPKQRRKNCKQYLKPWQGWTVSLSEQDVVQWVHVVVWSDVGASFYHGLYLTFWWDSRFAPPLNIRRRICLEILQKKIKNLARENKEESVLSQLYLSAVIKITAFPPNIHTLGFLWYLEGKAEIEWYLSKALSVITNHKRSLLLIIICWDILKCTVFVIVATSRWRSGAGRRYTYTLTSTITLLLEHMFGGSSLTQSCCYSWNQKVNPSEFWREIGGHQT